MSENKNPLIVGKAGKEDGYTVFKNVNKDIVNDIKTMEGTPDTFPFIEGFTMEFPVWGEDCKIVKELDETQLLGITNQGKYFVIFKKDLKELCGDSLMDEINLKYDVVDIINESLGDIYTHDGYRKLIFHGYKHTLERYKDHDDFEKIKKRHKKHDELFRVSAVEVGVTLDKYKGLHLVENHGTMSSGMFCWLNKEGNIENRDYNLDLGPMLDNKPKTKEDLINEIIEEIPDVSYKRYGDKFYSKDFAYVIGNTGDDEIDDRGARTVFYMEYLPSRGGDSYGAYRTKKIKMPKRAVESSKEELLSVILPLVNECSFGEKVDLSKYISTYEEVETVPVKRVQKTKIKEKDFTQVFDMTDTQNEDLRKACYNISNGIDSPKNEDIVIELLRYELQDWDLPSYSFDKGECQEDHSDFIGLVQLPHGCNYKFEVEEGDAIELRWDHSIYETLVVDLELID
jgi:hypothetical protein